MREEDSNAKLELPERLSVDSGILIAYLLGEKLGRVVKEEVLDPRLHSTFISGVSVAEASYILCRRRGQKFARDALQTFLRARYATLVSSEELDQQAGSYKCERAISLADCYVLAAANLQNTVALFAKREKDLEKEIVRRPLDVEIMFLEDFLIG